MLTDTLGLFLALRTVWKKGTWGVVNATTPRGRGRARRGDHAVTGDGVHHVNLGRTTSRDHVAAGDGFNLGCRARSWLGGSTLVVWAVLASCAAPDVAPPLVPQSPASDDAGPTSTPGSDPAQAEVSVARPAPALPAPGVVAPSPAPLEPEVWLKGSTHVHARPSGDSARADRPT